MSTGDQFVLLRLWPSGETSRLKRKRAPESGEIGGALWREAPVLIVGVPRAAVELTLKVGVGPSLAAAMCCPACGGGLAPWGGYARFVRAGGGTWRLRVRRARCRGCGRTHALLPSFLLARRRDVVAAVGEALRSAAAGRGHRAIARALALAESTVREWLRRLRARAAVLRARFVALAVALGELPARAPPHEGLLAGLDRAIGQAFIAARLRFGPRAVFGGIWAFASAASAGGLLSNTDSLW
jgi:transposase-like protein